MPLSNKKMLTDAIYMYKISQVLSLDKIQYTKYNLFMGNQVFPHENHCLKTKSLTLLRKIDYST